MSTVALSFLSSNCAILNFTLYVYRFRAISALSEMAQYKTLPAMTSSHNYNYNSSKMLARSLPNDNSLPILPSISEYYNNHKVSSFVFRVYSVEVL